MAEASVLTEASSAHDSYVHGPSSESIRIFLRSRPVAEPSENVQYDVDEGQLTVRVPKDASTGYGVSELPCMELDDVSAELCSLVQTRQQLLRDLLVQL